MLLTESFHFIIALYLTRYIWHMKLTFKKYPGKIEIKGTCIHRYMSQRLTFFNTVPGHSLTWRYSLSVQHLQYFHQYIYMYTEDNADFCVFFGWSCTKFLC